MSDDTMTRARMKEIQSIPTRKARFIPIAGASKAAIHNRGLMVKEAARRLVEMKDADGWHKSLAPLSREEQRDARELAREKLK